MGPLIMYARSPREEGGQAIVMNCGGKKGQKTACLLNIWLLLTKTLLDFAHESSLLRVSKLVVDKMNLKVGCVGRLVYSFAPSRLKHVRIYLGNDNCQDFQPIRNLLHPLLLVFLTTHLFPPIANVLNILIAR